LGSLFCENVKIVFSVGIAKVVCSSKNFGVCNDVGSSKRVDANLGGSVSVGSTFFVSNVSIGAFSGSNVGFIVSVNFLACSKFINDVWI
jgi:hypothetical protein